MDAPLNNANNTLLTWASSMIQAEIGSVTRIRSNEINVVFRLTFGSRSLFLKTGPNLLREYHRLQWLEGRLPGPRPVGFTTRFGAEALLMSAVEGEDLARLTVSLPPPAIIVRLASALQTLHATPIADWPFDRVQAGTVLVHGDACLPNFIYRDDRLSGYIDVGDMRVDRPEVDLAAAVWSLQYNLGPGHGLAFLQEYGVTDADEGDVERLRRTYGEGGSN